MLIGHRPAIPLPIGASADGRKATDGALAFAGSA
jgi:hypothetical protein